MKTAVDEIADRTFRLSTCFPDMVPGGFTFNQFLVDADEPLLFHCGMRSLFPQVSEATSRIVPLEKLRWISFGHVEADECGSMNHWLAAAPNAQIVHGEVGCSVSLNDLADRPPRALADGEILDLGGRKVMLIATPNVLHAWESILLFEETTKTLFSGDIFAHAGNGPAVTEEDLVERALEAEKLFQPSALTPKTAPTLRRLSELEPRTLAIMHGSCFRGDASDALRKLADGYAALFEEARASASIH